MNIIALDLSLAATGICMSTGDTKTLRTDSMRGMERLKYIKGQVVLHAAGCDLAILEGYSYGSKGASLFNIGELGGVIRLALWDLKLPCVEIAPASLKKYATGRGVGHKDQVIQAAAIRAGRMFEDNNQADAWWLHQMALAHYEPESPLLVKMPALNREALLKVAWVDVERRAA